MRYEILHAPVFPLVKVLLMPGEGIRAESSSMVGASSGVVIETGMVGGWVKSIGRALGGQSIRITTLTAPSLAGEVMLAPVAMGDIAEVVLRGDAYMVVNSALLAVDQSLMLHERTKLKGAFSTESQKMVRVSGEGDMLLSGFGAIHEMRLGLGEGYAMDTAHLVAFSDTMELRLTKNHRAVLGKEQESSVLAEFTGPGIVFVQTRSAAAFGTYLSSFLKIQK